MNADKSRCIDDESSTSRSLRSRRRWKKHVDDIFPMCWAIESSLSRITPRSRTESTGFTTTEQRLRFVLSCLSLARLALEPNHINSVLSVLSCSQRDEHPSLSCSTQSSRRWRCSATASRCMWVSSCESSTYRWWLTEKRSIVSTMSSV